MKRFRQIGTAIGMVAAVAAWAQDADTARSLLRAGQAEQAAQAYSALIERSPSDPDHWLGRGLALSRQGLWREARIASQGQIINLNSAYTQITLNSSNPQSHTCKCSRTNTNCDRTP